MRFTRLRLTNGRNFRSADVPLCPRTFIIGPNASGTPAILAGPDCAALGGAVGLVRDRDGDGFLVAVNRQDKITHVTADGEVALYATGDALDFPATLAPAGARWIGTSFAFASAVTGGSPRPGLFALTAGGPAPR